MNLYMNLASAASRVIIIFYFASLVESVLDYYLKKGFVSGTLIASAWGFFQDPSSSMKTRKLGVRDLFVNVQCSVCFVVLVLNKNWWFLQNNMLYFLKYPDWLIDDVGMV